MSDRNWYLSFFGSLFGVFIMIVMYVSVLTSIKYADLSYRTNVPVWNLHYDHSLHTSATVLEVCIVIAVLVVLILLVYGIRGDGNSNDG